MFFVLEKGVWLFSENSMKKFKEKIYERITSQKESCKKLENCALSAKNKKKQNEKKQKMKNHFREISFVVWFDTLSYRELCIFSKEICYYQKQSAVGSVKKGFLRNFAKCTGNHCARVSFLINLQALALSLQLY